MKTALACELVSPLSSFVCLLPAHPASLVVPIAAVTAAAAAALDTRGV